MNLPGLQCKSFTLALLAAGIVAASSPLNGQPTAMALAEKRATPEEFVLFPWDALSTPDLVKEAYECGFNVAGFCDEPMLDAVEQAGMKCFVRDPLIEIRGAETLPDSEITSRVKDIAARTASHPAVIGYHLLDEPRANLFPVLAKWAKAFREEAPEEIAYVNLLPEYGDTLKADGPFDRYIKGYIDATQPLAYSYDHYAFFEGGGMRKVYYSNLETARQVSQETGVPFWHIVLGTAHLHYAEVTPAILRLQAYSTLAYGARGLGYFTFTARERGNYRASAIDHYGRRTPTFDMMREVNLQIHRLAPALAKMKSVNVFHSPAVPEGCKGIESSQYVEKLTGGQFAVGEFESPEYGRALLVVNTSLTSSSHFRLTPKNGRSLAKISSYTGEVAEMSAEHDWLAPGQGMLILLKEK